MRIGHGYDVHRLEAGRKLVLGGVTIDWPLGLAGHSDADVLTHAVMDALLGAASMGDIGAMFPDTDSQYLGIDSTVLLRRVIERIHVAGYQICNIDVTLIAQQPKLAPYIPAMEERLAQVMRIDQQQINVKATTEEHLGFTGQNQGMACHCVCLLTSSNP